ncbi:hypothetical protein B0H10DRAFT_1031548 [Mycena sp. CBHHK59/15]|nr:hypothetical protein B0H10DRAFT_1031548 [Mycena sp. CBHHK59/15]
MQIAALVVSAIFWLHSGCFAFPPSYFANESRIFNRTGRTLGGFSADQLIEVTGEHSFKPPGDDDMRGPCPGLNAMANHGFIPHDGVVTLTTGILQSNKVFGLGIDTAAFAGVLALFGADLLSLDFPFSIGGAVQPGLLSGILGGTATGLSGTHNQFESDSSVTRGDYYQFQGNNHELQLRYFQALYDLQPESPDANYNLDVIFHHSQIRFNQSVAEDPYFFYGPVEMLVSCLTHNLVPGLMSNHSAEHPDGILSQDVLKSIYAVSTAPDGSLRYTPGHERIPDNWYRRSLLDPYGAQHVIPDMLAMWLRYPQLVLVGGNINGVNSYAPIDVSDLTKGVYSAASLLEDNNVACFVFQAVQILAPAALSGVVGVVGGIVERVVDAAGAFLADLTCPQLDDLDRSILERYPGYSKTKNPV